MRLRINSFIICFAIVIGALGCRAASTKTATAAVMTSPLSAASFTQDGPEAPEFPATLQWLNIDRPLSVTKDLRGKVVVLDFWTFCCINCMHIIPDLKKLEAKYPLELQVIGVHSAKFLNEKDTNNIREAVLRYEIEHPVINDNRMEVWGTYGVQSWPTIVVIAPNGKVVGGVSGEGNFEILNRVIADLIKKAEIDGTLRRKPIKLVLEKDNRPKSVLAYPGKITADEKSRRLFFTDSNHNRVVVASLTGEILEVIGEGNIGLRDGDYQSAQFFRPQGLAYDSARDTLYVADTENHAIRKIDLTAKRVTTLAGTGKQTRDYPPIGGVGRLAALSSPWDVTIKGATLFIAMAGTHQLWTLNLLTHRADPYAGTARENILDGPLTSANLAQPSGITTDGTKLYFADSEVSAVRMADASGTGIVSTLIGQGLFEFGDIDGRYPSARLQHPLGVVYRDGFVYVADTYNHKIKRIDPKTRTVVTVVGTGKRGLADGPARQASLNEPAGLTFAGNKLYIADTNNSLIRVYHPDTKVVSTLKFSGVDKLVRKTIQDFRGKTVQLPAQEVSADAKSLDLMIELPKGTKFNLEAPFQILATSDKPDAVSIGAFSIPKPSARMSIPITPKSGDASVTVELDVNYCNEDNEGLCFFKEVRLVIPVRVTAAGAAAPVVMYAL